MKKTISTPKAPEAIGPYAQGIDTGSLIFTSGQLPINPATGEMMTTIKEATAQALNNLKAVLEAGGSSMDKVVKCTVFLEDMSDFGEMNEVYGKYFGENPPARSAIEVAALPKDAIVEIEAIALKN